MLFISYFRSGISFLIYFLMKIYYLFRVMNFLPMILLNDLLISNVELTILKKLFFLKYIF
jgi:hypothetical protein